MEDKGGDHDVKAAHHHNQPHHQRRLSQKELDAEREGEQRRSTLVVDPQHREELSGGYHVMKVKGDVAVRGEGPSPWGGGGRHHQTHGDNMDTSAVPKDSDDEEGGQRTSRSGTITMEPDHLQSLAESFRVVSHARNLRSVKSRSDSLDSSGEGGADDKEGGILSSTLSSSTSDAKTGGEHQQGGHHHHPHGGDVKAQAKGVGHGGREALGEDGSKVHGLGNAGSPRHHLDSSFPEDIFIEPHAHHTNRTRSPSTATVTIPEEKEGEEELEDSGDKALVAEEEPDLRPIARSSMDGGEADDDEEDEGRRGSSAAVNNKSSFVLSFDHGLSLDQSTSLKPSPAGSIDTPGGTKLTGVRRGRPDPLLMGAPSPGAAAGGGGGDDFDPSMAISLKFSSPGETDYSFGEMTMRTLNTSTTAETVIVRSPSDSLVRDFLDFERYYDMGSIQLFGDEVQGAQGRVYRIMKRPLAFQQPSTRLQNPNQRRDSGSSWVVVKECTQNAKLDALCFPRREWSMIRQLAHPHVIRLADTHIYNLGDKYKIVMEEMDCNLQQLMKGGSKGPLLPEHRLPVPLALEITYLIGLALLHLNSKLVVFLDLKPDNILCSLASESTYELARDSTGRAVVKLTDFGTCKFIGGDERHPPDFISVGTPGFQSPESRQDRYTTKADVFSLGCVLYTLVTGVVPFAGLQANDEMVEDADSMRETLDRVTHDGVRALLSRMLCWQPRKRISMDKVVRDHLFQPFLRPGDIMADGPLDEQVAVQLGEITVNIQLLDISTLHDPDAVVLSTAYENSLADTRRTATSYAAALMAALEVPNLRKFGEEFRWYEPISGLRTRDLRIVQMSRMDGGPLGNLGGIWMALFKNRESKTRHTLIQMYQYWRVALPEILAPRAVSKLYMGFLGVSRAFNGVSNSRILRQMVAQELLSLAEFVAISPDMPPGHLRTILLYEWKFANYSLFMSELAALCLECTLGFMGDDLLAILDAVVEAMEPGGETKQGLKRLLDALKTALAEATQEFCSALAFSQVCRAALDVALHLHPRWRRVSMQPMMASPHSEMEDREVLEDALELLDYLGERGQLDEDMLLKEGASWLVMTGELDARRALVCLNKVIPDGLRPKHVRKQSVDSDDEEGGDHQPATPQRGLSVEAAEARRRSSEHRSAHGEEAK